MDALLHLQPPSAALVTLSGGGKVLRGWATADGALQWEHQLTGNPLSGPVAVLLLEGGTLACITGSTVQVGAGNLRVAG